MTDPNTSPGMGTVTPRPDPTVLTTEQLLREIAAVREHIASELAIRDERLRGMDKATSLRLDVILDTPPQIAAAIGHEREITAEKFKGVERQFAERDVRIDTISSLNKIALDAAFAAQKEAAAKQDEANQKAIDKSEKNTNESIAKLGSSGEAANAALADKIEDIKTRMTAFETNLAGMLANQIGGRDAITSSRAAVMYAIGVVLFAIVVAGFVIGLVVKP